MIKLEKIDQSNWEACIRLKPRKEQEQYIASNLYSIAEVQFLHGFEVKAIYLENDMIGFAMYGIDQDDGNYWIYRFMIDAQFQGRGYGYLAMLQIIDEISKRADRSSVLRLGYNPNNEQAKKMYAKLGFQEEGIAPWGEMLASYQWD
ncbi:spermidine acetyltransferase [Paenibacillus montaniterrae]|uniref:Spermidine acetyltransferase n=1 Tax=Paenibacillus montaniterrae TaxID=429341 RepID=A0A919YR12_9BACL|nr:GNAT family N-acetyltransferase [Paenibacillus montaniterrae]GIP18075.1 spermidine acetyltransferase [Paenibacillus montaniterrae]